MIALVGVALTSKFRVNKESYWGKISGTKSIEFSMH
jgi:hypothetical protein